MRAQGFGPVYSEDCRVLILGSFPSVKSRAEGFYYANPQNRFFPTLCSFFGEETPLSVQGRRAFLLRNRIALWDVVSECEIEGSKDLSIKEETVSDIPALFEKCGAEKIFCNGKTAFALLRKYFAGLAPFSVLLPSTSPANPRFSRQVWHSALEEVFQKPPRKP